TLPQAERFARAWWRATLALLVAPVAQSLLLAVAFRVLLTSDGVLGLPIGSGFIDILVVGTLLYFLFKVPFWMLHATFSGAETRAITQAKRIGSAVTKGGGAAWGGPPPTSTWPTGSSRGSPLVSSRSSAHTDWSCWRCMRR